MQRLACATRVQDSFTSRACATPYVRCLFCTHAAGFTGDFWRAYHEVLPKAPGFDRRKDLYLLYHYLNHTNLFGGNVLREWQQACFSRWYTAHALGTIWLQAELAVHDCALLLILNLR